MTNRIEQKASSARDFKSETEEFSKACMGFLGLPPNTRRLDRAQIGELVEHYNLAPLALCKSEENHWILVLGYNKVGCTPYIKNIFYDVS